MIFVHEVIPPSGRKFASAMCYTEKFVRPLVESLVQLEHLRIIPDMTEIYRYYIYSLSRDLHKHGNSVILRTQYCHYFVMELSCTYEYDGCPRIFMTVESFHGDQRDLVLRGRVWDSGLSLIHTAFNMLDRLSYYFRYENNAMRFLEKFITILGIGYFKFMHDHERVLLMTCGFSAAEIFLKLYKRAPRPEASLKFYAMTKITTLEKAYY